MAEAMVDVDLIRFTQEHVYDSFNANDDRAMNVVDLIERILRGEKTPRDLPLIRVAAKKGAYWCVDNRRLFVYKHCQLGEIPVHVCSWKENREFELKWKNGLAVRAQTGGGRRVGVIQRTDVPFPKSPVAEPSLSKIRHCMTPAEQQRHDDAIIALKATRSSTGSQSKALGTDLPNRVLYEMLQPIAKASVGAGNRKKRRKSTRCAKSSEGVTDTASTPVRSVTTDAGSVAKRPRKKRAARQQETELEVTNAGNASSPGHPGGTVLKLTLGGDDSGDEDYAVEVYAPS